MQSLLMPLKSVSPKWKGLRQTLVLLVGKRALDVSACPTAWKVEVNPVEWWSVCVARVVAPLKVVLRIGHHWSVPLSGRVYRRTSNAGPHNDFPVHPYETAQNRGGYHSMRGVVI